MLIVSYDIANDKIRGRFAKMLAKNGAIRLQYSVYEINNTKRTIDNILIKIKSYTKHFTADDSIIIFEVQNDKLTKYGSAIHIDRDIVYI